MSFTIQKRLTPYNFTNTNNINRIKYIVIHYFGSLGSAASVANYFASAYRGASAHYSLDEGDIVYQSVEDEDTAWHCGTSGAYKHPYCRNSNSLGIEVQPQKIDKSRSYYASDTDWYFTEKVIQNLIVFTAYLMKKYNVPLENVVRHYDVTGKYCPRPMMGDDVNTYYNTNGNAQWELFKMRLKAYLESGKIIEPTNPEEEKYLIPALGVVTSHDDLNVRSGPSTSYSVIATAKSGTVLKLSELTADKKWYKLVNEGYVSASYINITRKGITRKDMDEIQEKFDTLMQNWLNRQAERTDSWLPDDVVLFNEATGIMKGNEKGNLMLKKFLTREEALQMQYNIEKAREEGKI